MTARGGLQVDTCADADRGREDRAPLVGRARELDRLDALLRRRTGGTGPVAVDVTGEPGIGKSRLLAEFAVRARRQGATVLRGRAGPAEPDPGPPFQAFVDAFADLDHRDRALFPTLMAVAELVESREPAPAVRGGGGGGDDVDAGYTGRGAVDRFGRFDRAEGAGSVGAAGGDGLGMRGSGSSPAVSNGSAVTGTPAVPRTSAAAMDPATSGTAATRGTTGASDAPGAATPGASGGPPGPESTGQGVERETDRVRRVAAALGRVAAPGLVLVLDDFHGADPVSVALVDHLLRHPLRAPVLLVLARRERQTPPGPASVLARAAESGDLARLVLGPLTAEACAEGLVPGLTPDAAREIHAVGRGNPLYHRALAHARTRRGEGPGTGPVAMVLDELAPLTGTERAVVEALAVLDGRATVELLTSVASPQSAQGPQSPQGPRSLAIPQSPPVLPSPAHPTGRAVVDKVLSELTRRDLVRHEEDGRVLVLRHSALSELVRGTLDPWHRRELHGRAARALAEAGAPVTERAPHLVRATTVWDPAVAAELVEAAERIGAADPACAAHWLAAVLALLPDTSEHLARRHDLMLRRAQALGSAGRVAESRDLLHQLIDACRPGEREQEQEQEREREDTGVAGTGVAGTGDAADVAELRTSAVLLCAFMERHLGRYPEADALLRRELERTPGPRPDLRTWLVVEWGCRALFAARYPEVRPVVARTLDEARRRRDEAGTAESLTLAALGEAYEGETAAARVHAAEAAALTDAFTDGELAAHAESLVRLGWTEVFLEQYGSAERHATRGIEMARRAGRPFALSQLLLCSAYVHFLTARVGTALGLAEEALAVARTLGGAELVGFSGAIRAVVLLHARPLGAPEALAAAEEAAATVGTAEGWWATQARGLLGFAVPLGRDPHRVREVLVRAGGDRDLSRLQPSLRPHYLELLAGAALATGDVAEAERVARRALSEAEPLGLPVQRAAALRAWGQVLARRGESAAAARAFTDAARESARAGAVLREAHSLLLAAPMVRAGGDESRAAAQWRRGRRLAVEGGARMLVDLADRTRPAPPDGAPGGRLAVLTPREREISVLVAEGLTNQAVADRLCLSPRTVESHVARVYRKTGVETRAGLASLVVRDGVGDGQSLRG
ncbi:AAA family ATPase [Streptomyces sp. NPDC017254]|uniref:AAA family ATPase n=1 Tax=unclassified Streptomyces TaxID=2593676 RepID=UPI0037903372